MLRVRKKITNNSCIRENVFINSSNDIELDQAIARKYESICNELDERSFRIWALQQQESLVMEELL